MGENFNYKSDLNGHRTRSGLYIRSSDIKHILFTIAQFRLALKLQTNFEKSFQKQYFSVIKRQRLIYKIYFNNNLDLGKRMNSSIDTDGVNNDTNKKLRTLSDSMNKDINNSKLILKLNSLNYE